MQQYFESRHSCSPGEAEKMNTDELREHFLIQTIFQPDSICLTLSYYDRFIAGGIMPVSESIALGNPGHLKATYFLERRELGVINVGGSGRIIADGHLYQVNYREALYIGKDTRSVQFLSEDPGIPAKFYVNSAPAHWRYETKKISFDDAPKVELGETEHANHRLISKSIVSPLIETCQLQMGMTELETGSVWNTMPAHTHERRMEVYFYFGMPAGQSVCHFMGRPAQTRHIWMQNEQAVISPNWSIHAGAGTARYAFIWGMAGENLDYGDMDMAAIPSLK